MIAYLSALEIICNKALAILPGALAARRRRIEQIATCCQEISIALDGVADSKTRGEISHKHCTQLEHHRKNSKMFDVHSVFGPMERFCFALPQEVKIEMLDALNTALLAEYLDATDIEIRKASGIFLATAQQLRAELLKPSTIPQEVEIGKGGRRTIKTYKL
jgi:hypothetical protein